MKGLNIRRLCSWLVITFLAASYTNAGETVVDAGIEQLAKTGKAFSAVARSAVPSVVFIRVEQIVETGRQGDVFNDPFGFFGDDLMRRFFGTPRQAPQRRFRREGAGSGFIVSEDGYILTNSHVVGDANRIVVRLHDGREFDAEKIGTDEKSEVAIIKIEADNLPAIKLGDSSDLEVGEWVIAVGNPFGLNETVTAGIVSALGRSNIGITDYENFIQTDAAINPGNSGGPLLNIKGEVVGINTAIYTRSGGYMGVGFAIPINMAASIKQQLIDYGKVTRGYLGIYLQELTQPLADAMGLENTRGILIADVMKDSAAEEAGLEQGDIILQLDGNVVRNTGVFRNEISSRPPGTQITLRILRDGKELEIRATTRTLEDEVAAGGDDLTRELLGATVSEITPELAERFGYSLNEGVVLMDVEPNGRAARAGLRPGTLVTGVNMERIRDKEGFLLALVSAREQGRLVLRVRTGRFHQYVAIPLN